MATLTDWENFYVIVGSSAGALTGLMFVVITLIAGPRNSTASGDVAAYSSPTVVHFSVALVVSALLSAPWKTLSIPATLLSLGGLSGCVYAVIVFRRIVRRSKIDGNYNPVLEDWIWFAILPLAAYLAIFVAGILMVASDLGPALFIIAGALLLILVIGIHNAWDTVTYIAIMRYTPEEQQKQQQLEKDK